MKRSVHALGLLCADPRGTLYAHPVLRAAGMSGPDPVPIGATAPLPYGTRLTALPGWDAVGYDPATGSYEILKEILIGRRWLRIRCRRRPPGFHQPRRCPDRQGAAAGSGRSPPRGTARRPARRRATILAGGTPPATTPRPAPRSTAGLRSTAARIVASSRAARPVPVLDRPQPPGRYEGRSCPRLQQPLRRCISLSTAATRAAGRIGSPPSTGATVAAAHLARAKDDRQLRAGCEERYAARSEVYADRADRPRRLQHEHQRGLPGS